MIVKSEGEKSENHMPKIDCPDVVEAGKPFNLSVRVDGHPNVPEHYIEGIDVYICKEYAKKVAEVRFTPKIAMPSVSLSLKLDEDAEICAVSYCNVHGLWESRKKVKIRR